MRVVARLDHNSITIPPGAKPGDCIGVIMGIAENTTARTLYGGFKYVPQNTAWEEVFSRSMNWPFNGNKVPLNTRLGWLVHVDASGQRVNLKPYEATP